MPESMSISVNGQSQVPPGFRFHPTEEELLQYYLRKKVSYEEIDLDVIRDVDLNKLEPWDIQEACKIGSTPQNDWYFFSHKDKKYPTGTRTNRATAAGFWKATGRDKVIYSNSRRIGMRKTLVFYKGRAPHGQKSDWIMHEYRLDDNINADNNINNVSDASGSEGSQEEGWVVCRIFKKKNHLKSALNSTFNSVVVNMETIRDQIPTSSDEGTLEQLLQSMGRSCKKEGEAISTGAGFLMPSLSSTTERFMKLPSLESPNSISSQPCCYQQIQVVVTDDDNNNSNSNSNNNNNNITNLVSGNIINVDDDHHPNSVYETSLGDWTAFDRLVASQLNGQCDNHQTSSKQLSCFNDSTMAFCSPTYHIDLQLQHQLRSSSSLSNRPFLGTQDDINGGDQFDLWNFTRPSVSSSDPLCQISDTPV